ncbi:Fasciclin-like arabinogalactan protein 2 [Glycine soja]|nr:Fasciclin-like arabinogalactan protein 2 [Glycine soja]
MYAGNPGITDCRGFMWRLEGGPYILILLRALLAATLFLLTTLFDAHNITNILAKHPEFSTFNHYLTLTHLAPKINSKTTIIVYVIDNAAMSDLLSKHLSIYTIKNALSLHILLDYYFGAKKLH